jgi:tetrahydromethanopterin S-methyltransferase subunit F
VVEDISVVTQLIGRSVRERSGLPSPRSAFTISGLINLSGS